MCHLFRAFRAARCNDGKQTVFVPTFWIRDARYSFFSTGLVFVIYLRSNEIARLAIPRVHWTLYSLLSLPVNCTSWQSDHWTKNKPKWRCNVQTHLRFGVDGHVVLDCCCQNIFLPVNLTFSGSMEAECWRRSPARSNVTTVRRACMFKSASKTGFHRISFPVFEIRRVIWYRKSSVSMRWLRSRQTHAHERQNIPAEKTRPRAGPELSRLLATFAKIKATRLRMGAPYFLQVAFRLVKATQGEYLKNKFGKIWKQMKGINATTNESRGNELQIYNSEQPATRR